MKKIIFALLIVLGAAFSLTASAQNIESITAPAEISIPVGYSYQIKVEFSPSNAANKNLLWMSYEDDIASVSATGVVTGKKVGETLIHVQAEENEWKNAEIVVKVTAKGTEPIVPDPGNGGGGGGGSETKTCATPVISLAGGTFSVTCATPGATIRYSVTSAAMSLTGSGKPDLSQLSSRQYVLTATASASGYNDSAAASLTFTLADLASIVSNAGDMNNDGRFTVNDVARLIEKLAESK